MWLASRMMRNCLIKAPSSTDSSCSAWVACCATSVQSKHEPDRGRPHCFREGKECMAGPPHLHRPIKEDVAVLRAHVQRAHVAWPARVPRERARRSAVALQLALNRRAGRLGAARLGRAGGRQGPQRAVAGLRVGRAAVHQLVPLGPPPARQGSSARRKKLQVQGTRCCLEAAHIGQLGAVSCMLPTSGAWFGRPRSTQVRERCACGHNHSWRAAAY